MAAKKVLAQEPRAVGRRKAWQNVAGGILLLGAAATAAFRQLPADEDVVRRVLQQVGDYYANTLPEKAYLHLDKPVYATGETIWFSGYVVDAQRHLPDSLSKVLYVDLLSPERKVVARRTLRLHQGRTEGDIALSDSLAAGTYLLRAYTSWMRNAGDDFIYSRRLQVWPASVWTNSETTAAKPAAPAPPAGRPDVQFFPEGGSLVAGLPSVVACKAIDASGRGLTVRGQVLDGQGKAVVATFSSRHLGMGRFSFTPAAGQKYRAHLTLPDGSTADYPLPAVQPSGYTLHAVDGGDFYTVEARRQGPAAAGAVWLLAEVRGFLVYPGTRSWGPPTAPVSWKIEKKQLPNGILHLTLFDEQGTPQAERLAFVQNAATALKVSITTDKPSYGPHLPVQLTVRVADAAGQPVAAQLSVAVAEAGLHGIDAEAETIASNLLLTSDLAGYVENPGYYFRNPTPETSQHLDDLLLTQGWRRFVWKQVLSGTVPPVRYAADQTPTLSLSGQVVGEYGTQPMANAPITFMQSRPNRVVASATATADGLFRFTGFDGRDTAVVTLQARRAQGTNPVRILPELGPATTGPVLPALPGTQSPAVADYVRRSRQQQVDEHNLHPEDDIRNIQLSNVSVTAKRLQAFENDPRHPPGAIPSTTINMADILSAQSAQSLLQLLQGRVAGLVVSGQGPNATVQIRGQGSPMILLDGMPSTLDAVQNMPASEFESVEVYKGTDAAIFGSRASGGALAVYTKRRSPNFKALAAKQPAAPGLSIFKVPPFYQTREFYQPRYNALVVNSLTDPRRTTLYWNPSARTNASGETKLYFFTADAGGTFQAVVEGVSATGQPAQASTTLVARPK
ncbi:TonB-dependent receptor plug domain-containing protein [Hymenobacter sp. ASUV-10]|uniref:TonB-dependent receptor plug domain-containing protein n=1 Tax=Hymenobacter aranciens TaxID=3063996 RepID=A0ABT9B9J5_9BACT|nr:TonB-dependent receptor plug domain-containing protein [Hymenobacter sp. ASUV-10]MDO7874934.1 TonB-dependent receptor plug domain-containing protein [Hymenobacter sp. ASUV-10]